MIDWQVFQITGALGHVRLAGGDEAIGESRHKADRKCSGIIAGLTEGKKSFRGQKNCIFLLAQATVNTNEHRRYFCCHDNSPIDKEHTYFPSVKNNRQGGQIIWFYTTEGLL